MNELPLRDIHLPDPISWWPPAIGWWIVFGIVCFCILLGIVFLIQWMKPSLKKEALKALNAIEAEFLKSGNATKSMQELSILFRRVTMSQKNNGKSGGLIGKPWLELLDQQLEEPEFSSGAGQMLLTGPYQRETEGNISELIKLSRKWVKRL